MTTIAVSVTEFKAHCLDMIRQVEQAGAAVDLTRHGRVVARVVPMMPVAQGTPPWLSLRGAGALHATSEESVLDAAEFEALQARGK